MRAVLDRYADRVLIGEIYLPFDRLVTYYGKDLTGASAVQFRLIHAAWNAAGIAQPHCRIRKSAAPGGWPNWVLGNHDQPRIAARVGNAQARIAAMLLLTLRGTPTMYYGDEIGMPRVDVAPELRRTRGKRTSPGSASAAIRRARRCNGMHHRTPDLPRPPWLPLDPEYAVAM